MAKRSKRRVLDLRYIPTRSSARRMLEDGTLPGGASPEHDHQGDDLLLLSAKGGCEKLCRHLEKGVNLEKLSAQLAKSKVSLKQCQDCVKDSKSGTGKKGKGKSSRKKLVQPLALQNSSHGTNKWVCLACGRIGCGSISSSPPSQADVNDGNGSEQVKTEEIGIGHAWKHSLLAKHPLAVQCGDRLICWCFLCKTTVDFCFANTISAKHSEPEENENLGTLAPPGTGTLQEAVKLVREKLVKESVYLKNSENHDFVYQSSDEIVDPKLSFSLIDNLQVANPKNGEYKFAQRKRIVIGLMNLGNTCFFNSVMQNLLALGPLRDYFSQDSQGIEGPLTSSLRKLYLDTNADELTPACKSFGQMDLSSSELGTKKGGKNRVSWENGVGGVYSPRSLFGAICAKAPRFRGFQQQDSHELLRCLLDGLHTEGQGVRSTKGDLTKVDSLGKSAASLQVGDDDAQGSAEEENGIFTHKLVDTSETMTFVEQFFGGQLSSTVCCCECGHSSVVFEPFLDLSLPIPTKQSSKSLQGRAGQGNSRCFGGKLDKGSFRGEGKTKVSEKIGSSVNLQLSKEFWTEHQKIQPSELASALPLNLELATQGQAQTSEVLKVCSDIHDSLHDSAWMDYLEGGAQLAEGALQGMDDQNVQQSEESSGSTVTDIESIVLGNSSIGLPGFHVGTFEGSGKSVSSVKADHTAVEDTVEKKIFGTSHDYSVPARVSENNNKQVFGQDLINDVEGEQVISRQEEEQQPLPLTAEVLVLPYEKLQLSSQNAVEGTGDCSEIGSTSQGPNDASSDIFVDQDEGDFDGFSQLFDEGEESFSSKDKEEGKVCVDSPQVVLQNCMGTTWDVVSGLGNDWLLVGRRKEVVYQDAIRSMSLEGCLLDFTKSELLSGENAWGCENCTRKIGENMSLSSMDIENKKPNLWNFDLIAPALQDKAKLGKGKLLEDSGDVSTMPEKVTSRLEDVSNGGISHANLLNMAGSCAPSSMRKDFSDARATPLKEKDVNKASFETLCRGSRSCGINCNGGSPESSMKVKNGTGLTGLDPNLGIGNARLNVFDSGQLSGGQFPSCRTEIEVNGDNESLGGMIHNRSDCVEEGRETNGEEFQQHYYRSEDNVDGKRVGKVGGALSGKIQQDVDCSGREDFTSQASSSRGFGSFRISSKVLKFQRGKSRKTEPESMKVLKRDATKRLLINKAPPILTIHLKRFGQDIRGRLSKLSGRVHFQEWLDLRPFLDPKYPDSENCIYRLVGIVEHGGTMRGGHYIAYVRGPATHEEGILEAERGDFSGKSCWYCISDSHVRKSTLQAVLNSEAYLLFYEKCKLC